MSSLRHPSIALLYCSAAVVFSLELQAQTVTPQGGEFALVESSALRGDQRRSSLNLGANGGYVVWQDNAIDGSGSGIGARWIDSTLAAGVFGSFRVNQRSAGNQSKPQVALLQGGGAAFVWQGGSATTQNIYIRFISTNRVFTTANDIQVNVYTNGNQTAPAIAVLANGNVAVVWSSLNQDGSMQGVFARLLSPTGQFLTNPFRINEFTPNNQRDPAIAALSNGTFVVSWISEQQRLAFTADVMARLYNASGQSITPEFRVSVSDAICTTPAIAGSPSSGFSVVWAQKLTSETNGWDIFARSLPVGSTNGGSAFRVNTYTPGDQFAPRICSMGNNQLVVWTSMGEDGSWDGVFAQLLYDGVPAGGPFLVNDTTLSKQVDPVIGSDGTSRFLVAWSSFTSAANGFDLFAKRYAVGEPLPTPAAPFVSALRSSQLSVTWPPLIGYPLSYYEIYADGAAPPNPTARVTNATVYVQSGLVASSTHTFQLAYVFSGAIRSQLSTSGSGTTWAEDLTGKDGIPDGLPDDWQRTYWGVKAALWPGANEDSDGDGVSNFREFLAGTNPTDPNSVLKMWFTRTQFGRRLNWNCQPGFVYQVQVSDDLASWSDFGGPRFAAGTTDSTPISGSLRAEYYRVLRLR